MNTRPRHVHDTPQAAGLTIKVEPYATRVPRSQRGGEIVEPLVREQWFVRMKPLAEPALAAVDAGAIRIVPERFEKVYRMWLDNIKDWCISRQLWWGHRIPVWCGASGACCDNGCLCRLCVVLLARSTIVKRANSYTPLIAGMSFPTEPLPMQPGGSGTSLWWPGAPRRPRRRPGRLMDQIACWCRTQTCWTRGFPLGCGRLAPSGGPTRRRRITSGFTRHRCALVVKLDVKYVDTSRTTLH